MSLEAEDDSGVGTGVYTQNPVVLKATQGSVAVRGAETVVGPTNDLSGVLVPIPPLNLFQFGCWTIKSQAFLFTSILCVHI